MDPFVQSTSSTATDVGLVGLARLGDVNAFTEVVKRHQTKVFAVAFSMCGNRVVAEDTAQDTFVVGWQKLNELSEPSAVGSWLCGIARNLARKHHVRGGREQAQEIENQASEQGSPLLKIMECEAEESLSRLVDRIPLRYRDVVLLHYGAELSVSEISDCLSVSESAVKKRLSRGREMLRERADRFTELAEACRVPVAFSIAVGCIVSSQVSVAKPIAASGSITSLIAKGIIVQKIFYPTIVMLVCLASFFGYRAFGHQESSIVTAPHGASDLALVVPKSSPPPRATSAQLSGIVVDQEGHAVAFASVNALQVGGQSALQQVREMGGAPVHTVSDESGRFSLTVRPGDLSLSAGAPGFLIDTAIQISITENEQHENIELRLQAGGIRVFGTVTDVSGGAIAGTSIAVDTGRTAQVTTTQVDGRYELWLPLGSFDIQASHDGYASHRESVHVTLQETECNIALIPASVVEGVVLTADSETPVPGAILIAQSNGQDLRGTVSDSDGRFRVTGLPAGLVEIRATAPGLATHDSVQLDLGIAEYRGDVRVLIGKGYKVSGQVVTSKGLPVSGANVELGRTDGSSVSAQAATTVDGRFEIFGVAPGRWIVAVGHVDFPLSIEERIQVQGDDIQDLIVSLEDGQVVTGYVLPARAATVHVSLGDKKELSMALLSGNLNRYVNAVEASTRVGGDGKFTLPSLAPGRYSLVAMADDGSLGIVDLDTTSAVVAPIEIALKGTATLTGTLVEADDTPVAFAAISVRSQGYSIARTIRSDSRGRFAIPGVYYDSFDMELLPSPCQRAFLTNGRKQGVSMQISHGKEGSLGPLDQVTEQSISLGRQVVSSCKEELSGLVENADGTASADAWVVVQNGSFESKAVLTDESGHFRVTGLPAETALTLKVSHPVHGTAYLANVHPPLAPTVQLQPVNDGFGIRVVLDGKSVLAYTLHMRGPVVLSQHVVSPSGWSMFGALPEGEYHTVIASELGDASEVLSVHGAERIEVAIRPWAHVRGRARFPDGTVVANQAIFVANENQNIDSAFTHETTDAQGYFDLEHVSVDSVALIFMSAGETFGIEISPSSGELLDLSEATFAPR